MRRSILIAVVFAVVAGACETGDTFVESSVVEDSTSTTMTAAPSTTSPPAVPVASDIDVEHVPIYIGTAGPELFLFLDNADRPVALFPADREGPHEKPVPDEASIRLARCLDAECSEVIERALLMAPGWVDPNDLALTPDGRAVVAYFRLEETEEGPGPEATGLLFCADVECSDVLDVPFDDAMRVRVTSDGLPIVAHDHDGVGLIWCLDPECTERDELAPAWPGEGELLAFELSADGMPMVARRLWAEGDTVVEVTWCEDLNCGSTRQVLLDLSDGPQAEARPVVAFDGNGRPVLALMGSRIVVGTCPTDACTEVVYNEIGHAAEAEGIGLTVTADDHPVLAYPASDPTGEQWFIEVAVCDDPACVAGTIATIADHGTLAADVAIDQAGNPVVGHVYWSRGETNVYRCVDPRCETGALDYRAFDATAPAESRTPIGPPAEGWRQIETDGGGGSLMSVVAGETLTVFGTDECSGGECPIIGTSTDGLDWNWVRPDDGAVPMAMAPVGDTVVVSGQRCTGEGEDLYCVPIVWTLEGGSWNVLELPCDGCAGWVDTIAAWSGGITAFGVTNDGGGLWHSADGFEWTRYSIEGVFGPLDRFVTFTEADGELRAYGSSCVEADDWQLCEGALWTSGDGVTWTRDTSISGLEGFEFFDMSDTPSGYLMGGWVCNEDFDCDGAIMYSTDGLAWQDVLPDDAPAGLDRIVGVGDGIVGLGILYDEYWGEEVPFVAETSDMESWTYAEIPPTIGRFGVNDITSFGGALYAVGVDDDGQVAIWTRTIAVE